MEGRRRLLYSGSSRKKSQEYVKTEWRAGSPNEKERKLRRDLEMAERKTCGCGRAVGEIFKGCKPGFAFGPGQIDSLLHWHTGHHTALCDTHTPPPDPQGGTELGWRGRHHRKLFFSPLPLGEGLWSIWGLLGQPLSLSRPPARQSSKRIAPPMIGVHPAAADSDTSLLVLADPCLSLYQRER